LHKKKELIEQAVSVGPVKVVAETCGGSISTTAGRCRTPFLHALLHKPLELARVGEVESNSSFRTKCLAAPRKSWDNNEEWQCMTSPRDSEIRRTRQGDQDRKSRKIRKEDHSMMTRKAVLFLILNNPKTV